MSDTIERTLIERDPGNAQRYRANARRLRARLEQLDLEGALRLLVLLARLRFALGFFLLALLAFLAPHLGVPAKPVRR